MRQHKANGVNWTRFDSCAEFYAEAIKRGGYIATSRYPAPEYWAGADAVTWDEAIALANTGWKAGRNAMTAIAKRISVAGRVTKRRVAYDVTGDAGFDVGRAMTGAPDFVQDWRKTEVPTSGKKGRVVKIIVNVTYSAGIHESILRAKGAGIIALVDALETAGKVVELDCIFAEERGVGVYIPVKKAGQRLQQDQLAFAVGHPSFSRRFGHAITGTGISPGTPSGIAKECDIYIPESYLGIEHWKTEEKTIAWITAKLAEFGIALSGKR